MFDIIAFDADDTLWHNETLYRAAKARLAQLLSKYVAQEMVEQTLDQTEARNIPRYGYGIKGFALSMIETAVQVTDGRVQGAEINPIIDLAKEMLDSPIQLFEHAQETLEQLSRSHPLMIVTKGDLFDQQTKISRSGLVDYFTYIEIVAAKTKETYAAILAKYHCKPSRFVMVGNALKSDILPIVELGGCAVYIPYDFTWTHESQVELEGQRDKYYELEHLGLLPAFIEKHSA